LVERVLGKDEVTGSSPVNGSTFYNMNCATTLQIHWEFAVLSPGF
jgi:hypothetical protein